MLLTTPVQQVVRLLPHDTIVIPIRQDALIEVMDLYKSWFVSV
jgi:hypothetical protein